MPERSRTSLYGWMGWICSVPPFLLLVEAFGPPSFPRLYQLALPGSDPLALFFAAWTFGVVAAGTGTSKGVGGTLIAALGPVSIVFIVIALAMTQS
jgi:hypothetical protein